jgi:hypothetical protein
MGYAVPEAGHVDLMVGFVSGPVNDDFDVEVLFEDQLAVMVPRAMGAPPQDCFG